MTTAISRGGRCCYVMIQAMLPLLAALFLAAPAASQAQPSRSAVRPNVLFLFADDQRADTCVSPVLGQQTKAVSAGARINPLAMNPHAQSILVNFRSFHSAFIHSHHSVGLKILAPSQ